MAIATGTIEFLQPQWFWLLAIFALLALINRYQRVTGDNMDVFSQTVTDAIRVKHPLVQLMPTKPLALRVSLLRTSILWLVLCLLVCALAQPIRIGEKLPDPPQHKDIVFIVDTSVSMLLRDYVLEGQRIDRMNMLKTVLDQFVEKLHGNRMAIIVYGESAYTFVPLTDDYALLRRMLSRIETTMAGRFNAVGDAIRLAVNELTQASQQRGILILFSAVSQATGEMTPQSATALATQNHLPLFTVAIGASSEEAEEKRTTGLVYDAVNLPLLQSLAQHTGAQSYHAIDVNALHDAIAAIEKIEVQPVQAEPRYYQQALYFWPLLIGLIVLAMYHWYRFIVEHYR